MTTTSDTHAPDTRPTDARPTGTRTAGTEHHAAVPTPRRTGEGESWLARLGWEETD